MKLKQWIEEYTDITYADFKNLPETEQWTMREEHQLFCRKNQIHKSPNRRSVTVEEADYYDKKLAEEKERYEESKKIGGIDELGNYTALHHR